MHLILGGIYTASLTFEDLLGDTYTLDSDIQVLEKEEQKIEQNKCFLWIFNRKVEIDNVSYQLKLNTIVEIDNFEIVIDEETNAVSTFDVLKDTGAEAGDIVCFKRDNDILYWGIIDEVLNENGEKKFTYKCKYITNIFNQLMPMPYSMTIDNFGLDFYYRERYIQISFKRDSNFVLTPTMEGKIVLSENTKAPNQFWYVVNTGILKNVGTGQYLTTDGVTGHQLYLSNTQYDWKLKFTKLQPVGEPERYYNYIADTNNEKAILTLGDEIAEGTIVALGTDYSDEEEKCSLIVESNPSPIISQTGVEDFISEEIYRGWCNTADTRNIVRGREYLRPKISSHTPKQISLETEDDTYNLHTFMTNATQHYNIVYTFSILHQTSAYYDNWLLQVDIENKTNSKRIIDVTAQNVTNYKEVFVTDIVSKVYCGTKTYDYILYLKTDRTTTTDVNDPDLADGKTAVIYTENIEDAEQECLNVIEQNQYNHNISFTFDEYIPIGTPIAIKTKNQKIENTYISSIKITQNKFYEYQCGNIRINFIDKLLKERK